MEKLNQLDKQTKLSVTDSRTGKTYEIAIKDNYIKASDLAKI